MAKSLKQLLPTILKCNESWKLELLTNWPNIIGSLKTKVFIEKIQDSCLVLSVSDSCWLQELYLLSPLLLKTINQKLDRPRIKRLRFKQAGIKKRKKTLSIQKKRKLNKVVTLSAQEEKALEKIEDLELSKQLKKFLIRCYQEKE